MHRALALLLVATPLFSVWIGCQTAHTEPLEPATSEPVAPIAEPTADAAAPDPLLGVAEAQQAIADGRIQTLFIGEDAPDDYVVARTGFPGASMGCEPDDEIETFVRNYNATVDAWWAEHDLYADGAEIIFQRVTPETETVVSVSRERVSVGRDGGAPSVVESSLAERLQFGALVGHSVDLPVPATGRLGPDRDTVRAGNWAANWSTGGRLLVLPGAVDLFEQFATRGL